MNCACGKLLSLSCAWKLPYIPKGAVSVGRIGILYRSMIHTTATFDGRKKRDRLTVLNALASTVSSTSVGRAENYQIFHDRNLQPKSNRIRGELLAAIEHGTKAADYVLEKHPDLFPLRKPEPAWRKQPEKEKLLEVSVENLRYLMQSGDNITKVVDLYEMLVEKGDIDHDVHIDMLEFVSFHAVTTTPQQQEDEEHDGSAIEWGDNMIATRLFESIKEKGDARAYEVYILGLLKHKEIFHGFKIYEQLVDKKLRGSLYLYNTLLEHVCDVAESVTDRWNLVQDITRVMTENKVKPNLITFNNLLSIAAEREEDSNLLCLKLIREMRRLKISPSLGSYYYLLRADSTFDIRVLVSIIEDVKNSGAELVLQHPSDLLFFDKAMSLARYKCADLMAEELLNIVLDNGLQNMIGEPNLFYSNYICAVSRLSDDMDYVMKTYRKIVPKLTVPQVWVYQNILKTMQNCKDPRYVPELYDDMVSLRIPVFKDGAYALFKAMKENIPTERAEEFLFVIDDLEYWMDKFKIELTAETVSVGIDVLCLCGKYEEVKERLNQCGVLGLVPAVDSMVKILQLTLDQGNEEGALATLKAMANFNMDFSERIKNIVDDSSLLTDKRQNIESWFGIF